MKDLYCQWRNIKGKYKSKGLTCHTVHHEQLYQLENNGSLDNKWKSRVNLEYIEKNGIKISKTVYSKFLHEANSAFDHYDRHQKFYANDDTFKVITILCNTDEHRLDTDLKDPIVTDLSVLFNELMNSKRKLLQCYDCGTNARAIFLAIIDYSYRTSGGLKELPITEIQRMRKQYALDDVIPVNTAKECYKALTQNNHNLVFICSVGFGTFGHVWVIEKKLVKNLKTNKYQWRYLILQSALSSHLLIDFIEMMDYANNPFCIDIRKYFEILYQLLSYTGKWTEREVAMNIGLFAFKPVRSDNVYVDKPGFSYTYTKI